MENRDEILYGRYKNEEGLSNKEINSLMDIYSASGGLSPDDWLGTVGYDEIDKMVMKRLPYPENGTSTEEENYTNFLNDKVYLVVRKAIEEKVGL
tara:strand:+ start:63 stop:347 length:285 start_codon:yes stop_codon:yes gene_type:complete